MFWARRFVSKATGIHPGNDREGGEGGEGGGADLGSLDSEREARHPYKGGDKILERVPLQYSTELGVKCKYLEFKIELNRPYSHSRVYYTRLGRLRAQKCSQLFTYNCRQSY